MRKNLHHLAICLALLWGLAGTPLAMAEQAPFAEPAPKAKTQTEQPVPRLEMQPSRDGNCYSPVVSFVWTEGEAPEEESPATEPTAPEGVQVGAPAQEERQVYLTLDAPAQARMGDVVILQCHLTGYPEGVRVLWQSAPTDLEGNVIGEWQDDGVEGLSRPLTLSETTLLTAWRVQITEPQIGAADQGAENE